jgi:hypothetical protein
MALVSGLTTFGNLLPGQKLLFARGVISFALILIAGAAALDFYLEWKRVRALGPRIKAFARNYPLVMASLAFFFGMLVAHLFFSVDGTVRVAPQELALQPPDLPAGYSPDSQLTRPLDVKAAAGGDQDPEGLTNHSWVRGYRAVYMRGDATGPATTVDILISLYWEQAGVDAVFPQLARSIDPAGGSRLRDPDLASDSVVFVNSVSGGATPSKEYRFFWHERNVITMLVVTDSGATLEQKDVFDLAKRQNKRITGKHTTTQY